jgi:hypothetical protein
MPYFSIILPTYNRAEMIGRAVDSCLRQDFTDFELIIVDDASEDHTIQRVRDYADDRIVLLSHQVNQGVCAARNTGIDAAKGAWLVRLDSDFELLPGALTFLRMRTCNAGNDVGNVASSCQWDTGIITPMPSVPSSTASYTEYLEWLDAIVISEWFNCIRREVFDTVRYPQGRAYEGSFHLALARGWKIEISREPAIIFHTDAENRITASPPPLLRKRMLRDAHDSAQNADEIVREHGEAMRMHAPTLYKNTLNNAAIQHFLDGNRLTGIGYSLLALKQAPIEVRYWATLLIGVLGPGPLAWAKARRRLKA